MLQVKVLFISFFCSVLFFEEPVNAVSNGELDFRKVIEENSQYVPTKDMCTRRILGGQTVDIEEVPYQVLILKCDDDYWELICGGAIVTDRYVVSAAHCFQTKGMESSYRVVAGTGQAYMCWRRTSEQNVNSRKTFTSEIWRQILNLFTHTYYSKSEHQNDFAVLELDIPVNFSRFVQPIPMMKTSYGIELKDGDLCMVTGFGETEKAKMSRYLRMVCLPFVSRVKCANTFGFRRLTENQFCAGDFGKDCCKGDSGGPITFRGYLVGIVSYGQGGCGQGPGIFTKISAYTTGELIPLSLSQSCVMLSLNILKVVFFVFSIFVHNFVVTNFFVFNRFCA
ncbi:hypothetical protein PYW08_003330 [Mythimna loreyi]|uniref:Uncharacterized protein n=1 Tax=Mythimna loreyi TaxID=667449 RepID=A0ACC2QW18_9NEOP|nr:hypothetical protein PYW08_003330 [Mythimna loreyi]